LNQRDLVSWALIILRKPSQIILFLGPTTSLSASIDEEHVWLRNSPMLCQLPSKERGEKTNEEPPPFYEKRELLLLGILNESCPLFNSKWNFAEGSEFKYVKHRIDALDKEKMSYSYTLIEGDALTNILESISYEIKIESTPEGGSKGKNSSTYHTKPGVEIKEEDIKAGKEKAAGVFKAVEAYLLANPDAYVN
ncbi:major allergen Pru ar 1-like, partial [Olea europaea var. sylvestris]|uniref:major allergen Pru ar 1-like n=1 Tax=Olea europaea var. sylvestris TaxID=158386 RepID=UPI000C1CDFCA